MPRLYVQRGLSDRVVTAIVRRLERALTMSSSNRVDAVEETRTRSRSRTRDEAAGTPGGTGEADAPASGGEAGVPAGSGEVEMSPGAPGVPPPSTGETVVPELGVPTGPGGVAVEQPIYVDPNTQVHQVLDASNQLAMRIGYCTNALVSVGHDGHDLSVSTDSFTTGQVSLRTALEEISTSLQAQTAAVTTLGAGLTFETTEITKLLKAFDRFAASFKWVMSGSNSMEKNLQSIQQAIEDQTGKVVAAVQTGFEGVEKQLRAVAAVLERIAQNTASQAVPPPPTFPPFPPPGGLTAPASVGVPSTAGVEVATPGGTIPLTLDCRDMQREEWVQLQDLLLLNLHQQQGIWVLHQHRRHQELVVVYPRQGRWHPRLLYLPT